MKSPATLPSISVVIPVGGNRAGDLDKIHRCVTSLLEQDYDGHLEVLLVIDPDHEALKRRYADCSRVILVDFVRPPGLKGRDANARWKLGWQHARGDVLASTGVSLEWCTTNASTAIQTMRNESVEAVDGITRRAPSDRSFVGLFRDAALVSEFAPFKRDVRMTAETMASGGRLPTFVSFFMTRQYYERIRRSLPVHSGPDGWDDFYTASEMLRLGGPIFCTNLLVAYLRHGATFRMHKQFASGVGAARYCWDHAGNGFARRRLIQTVLVALALAAAVTSAAAYTALHGIVALGTLVVALAVGLSVAGVLNLVRARDWRAFFFPPITLMQIVFVVSGTLYASMSEDLDDDFLAIFRQNR